LEESVLWVGTTKQRDVGNSEAAFGIIRIVIPSSRSRDRCDVSAVPWTDSSIRHVKSNKRHDGGCTLGQLLVPSTAPMELGQKLPRESIARGTIHGEKHSLIESRDAFLALQQQCRKSTEKVHDSSNSNTIQLGADRSISALVSTTRRSSTAPE
jgi:hypothetical protein